jgi:hypothetical protein
MVRTRTAATYKSQVVRVMGNFGAGVDGEKEEEW